MEDKNNCNPDISALFDDAASDLPLPEERVTNKARLALQERKAEQKVLRPAPETGCQSRVTGSFYHEYRFYLLAAVMAALLIVVAFFLPIANKQPMDLNVENAVPLSYNFNQLVANSADYSHRDFIPFVQPDDIISFEQYTIRDGQALSDEEYGKAVMYAVEYRFHDSVLVSLKVEVGAFRLRELDSYKFLSVDEKMDGMKLEQHDSCYKMYFYHNEYSYNMDIKDATDADVKALIADINGSF